MQASVGLTGVGRGGGRVARRRRAFADSTLVEERQVKVVGKHDGSGEQRFL